MSGKIADTRVGYQVELGIRRLDSLSMLPCVAAQLFTKLMQGESLSLADIIESDPVLTAKIFSVLYREGLMVGDEKVSVRRGLGKLSAPLIRDAFFSVKVYQSFDPSGDGQRGVMRRELVRHCLAVGCCAKDIAAIIPSQMDSELAYSAGLLHDIGKLALDEAMPKSFECIVEEAKSQSASSCIIEQKRLGVDHTILGKHLAQKWHLPEEITLAIWLHHSDAGLISEAMPSVRIAQVVQLADLIVHQCGIGQSGSYDVAASAERTGLLPAVSREQLEQIRGSLAETVRQKSEILGLDLPRPQAACFNIVHSTAAQLAGENTRLSVENRRLQTASSHFEFIRDFLLSINSNSLPIDIAEKLAVRWQNFYQTGPVCLYLAGRYGNQFLKAVVVEVLSQSKLVYLNAPINSPVIPQALQKKFAILNVDDCVWWLFEQLDVDFNVGKTKIMPLLCGGKAVGAIVCEFRYPADLEQFEGSFKAATSIAGCVLDMAFSSANRQEFAEQFARVIVKVKDVQDEPYSVNCVNSLAEMAGGAAHELNNPLSVISGRAQMLAESETDAEKRQILKQIQANSSEISGIIDGLMSFAQPAQPRPTATNVKQMLDEVTELAAQKTNAEQFEVEIDVAETCKDVFVDSAQIVSAIANIFSNAVESYRRGSGPIKVTSCMDEGGDFVKLQVSDFGCGMDRESVQKATQPFFSAKPAGRKRGMGLAYAQRLIQLNGGSLNITSKPGVGTTVTIYLPCK